MHQAWSQINFTVKQFLRLQGPVVQSIVSLTSSLRVISLTILADSIYNILIFFAEKMWVAFAHCKSYSHFFSKKFQHICVSLDVNFNELLTNDIISFEQLGPGCNLGNIIYVFIIAYVMGTQLNCLDKLRQFKWVPTTCAYHKLVEVIQMSTSYMLFYDKNQNTSHKRH